MGTVVPSMDNHKRTVGLANNCKHWHLPPLSDPRDVGQREQSAPWPSTPGPRGGVLETYPDDDQWVRLGETTQLSHWGGGRDHRQHEIWEITVGERPAAAGQGENYILTNWVWFFGRGGIQHRNSIDTGMCCESTYCNYLMCSCVNFFWRKLGLIL